MASRLDDDSCMRAWIGKAIRRLRPRLQGEDTLTALIWSVRRVVVVRLSQQGITHSRAVPVLEAFRSDEKAFDNAVDMLMYYLRPSFITHEWTKSTGVATLNATPVVADSGRPTLPMDIVTWFRLRGLAFIRSEQVYLKSMSSGVGPTSASQRPQAFFASHESI